MNSNNQITNEDMQKMMNNPQFMQMMMQMMNNPGMMQQMNPGMMGQMNPGMMPQMNPMMMGQMNPGMMPQMNPMMMGQMNPAMMQMFMNMNAGNQPNMPNINTGNPGDWNLIFEKKNGSQIINVQVSPDSTVQSAINMYKIKTNTPPDEEIKFIFNGKQLNYSLSLSASGLMNGSKITVISTKDVEGA